MAVVEERHGNKNVRKMPHKPCPNRTLSWLLSHPSLPGQGYLLSGGLARQDNVIWELSKPNLNGKARARESTKSTPALALRPDY